MDSKLHLGQVNLNVNNLEKVSHFYQLLGFESQAVNDQVTLSIDNNPLIVLHQTNLPRKNEVGLYHLGLKVPTLDDFTSCVLHLKNERIKISGTSKYPCMKSIYFSDPENNGIELYVDLPMHNNCLEEKERTVMYPLDLNQIIQTCDKEPSALPINTIIGRIHLHVLELDDSEKYYKQHLGLRKSYAGKNDSFLSKDHHEDYLGLNTWLPGCPSTKNFLSPGLRNFTVYMEPSLFDLLYDPREKLVALVDPNKIHSTVYRGLKPL